jgi:hypothetical protein
VLFWLGFLRDGIYIPALSWTLVILTITAAVLLQRRLAARLWIVER